jgi:hypothetical protein
MCRVLARKIERLQAVHNKFRAVVDVNDSVSLTWHNAKHSHRKAFENFFVGWKPLPPSMTCPAHKALRKAVASAAYLTPSPTLIDTTHPEDTAVAAAAPPCRRHSRLRSRDLLPSTTATATPRSAPAPQAADQGTTTATSQAFAAQQAALLANFTADPSFSLWALSRGLGAAVPPLAAYSTVEQEQHGAELHGPHPHMPLQLGEDARSQPSCNPDSMVVRAVATQLLPMSPASRHGRPCQLGASCHRCESHGQVTGNPAGHFFTMHFAQCTSLSRSGSYRLLLFGLHLKSPLSCLKL